MRRLFGFDRAVLGYVAAVTVIIAAFRPRGAWIYLAYHALALLFMALVIGAEARYGGRFWRFLRTWYVVPVILAAFREIHFLVPEVHPFEDLRYDRILEALDRRFLGDVDGFFLSAAHPLLVDFLHVCYWSYFVLTILPGALLYARGELEKVREYSTVLLAAFFISYLGYFAVPAVGPHWLHLARPPELDGWLVGRHLHAALMEIEWRMPDAFPSGHVLVTTTVLILSWRLHRRAFWGLLLPGVGIVAATMVLRYHYVVDVLAAAALLPAAVFAGTELHRRAGGGETELR